MNGMKKKWLSRAEGNGAQKKKKHLGSRLTFAAVRILLRPAAGPCAVQLGVAAHLLRLLRRAAACGGWWRLRWLVAAAGLIHGAKVRPEMLQSLYCNT